MRAGIVIVAVLSVVTLSVLTGGSTPVPERTRQVPAEGGSGGHGYFDCCKTITHWAEFIFNAALCLLLLAVALVVICIIVLVLIWLFVVVKSWPTCPRPITKCGLLQTKRLEDGSRKLTKELKITIQDEKPIIIPKGFITDFSSIPLGLRWTIHWKRVDLAGVVHDWLYAIAKNGGRERMEVDWIWWDVALSGKRGVTRANRFQAAAGWLGIKVGAKGVWKCYEKYPPDKVKACKDDEDYSCADCQHRVPGTDGGDEQASEGEGLGDEIGGGEQLRGQNG